MNFNESIHEFNEKFLKYFETFSLEQINHIQIRSKDEEKYIFTIKQQVFISLSIIFNKFHDLIGMFLMNPVKFLIVAKKSIIELKQRLIQEYNENGDVQIIDPNLNIYINLTKIPYLPNIYKNSLNLNQENINKIIVVNGTITRGIFIQCSQYLSNFLVCIRKSLEKFKTFQCNQPDCLKTHMLYSDPQNYNKFSMPSSCDNMVEREKKVNPFFQMMLNNKKKDKQDNKAQEKKKENKKEVKKIVCGGKKFIPVQNTQQFIDCQEIKLQESFKNIQQGKIPQTIWVVLTDHLVEQCKPGDDVTITGILMQRCEKFIPQQRPNLELFIYANTIYIHNKEMHKDDNIDNQKKSIYESYWVANGKTLASQIQFKNEIIKSICPKLYGNFEIKLSLLLTVIGGVSNETHDTKLRGQSHMLIIGEPGTGKSTILQFASQLSQRVVKSNGVGASSAGLTLGFIREGPEWSVEAGALVLADMGICCIDEFNHIKKQDQACILEAMEQQTVSAAKAGTTIKVNSRCTIIAVCNPVMKNQKFNQEISLAENAGLSTPLLSRFDLVFVQMDDKSQEEEIETCDFILKQFMIGTDKVSKKKIDHQIIWNVQKIREYIEYVKQKFTPQIDDEAQQIIIAYYKYLRNIDSSNKVTTRQLESLVRLCQAHARLMHKEIIEIYDAVSVIQLYEKAFNTGLMLNLPTSNDILHTKNIYQYLIKFSQIEENLRENLLSNQQMSFERQ